MCQWSPSEYIHRRPPGYAATPCSASLSSLHPTWLIAWGRAWVSHVAAAPGQRSPTDIVFGNVVRAAGRVAVGAGARVDIAPGQVPSRRLRPVVRAGVAGAPPVLNSGNQVRQSTTYVGRSGRGCQRERRQGPAISIVGAGGSAVLSVAVCPPGCRLVCPAQVPCRCWTLCRRPVNTDAAAYALGGIVTGRGRWAVAIADGRACCSNRFGQCGDPLRNTRRRPATSLTSTSDVSWHAPGCRNSHTSANTLATTGPNAQGSRLPTAGKLFV